ncbi:beta-lactamase family protein [Rubinisphaera sp. ICM_H10]|nr:beta-lactamase family protein [Rubinisphaera margarita]
MSVSIGEAEFDDAVGFTDETRQLKPADPMFWLSSAKPITAAAILQLQERSDLQVSDPLQRFFPGFPEWLGTATLAQLLSHFSRLPEVHSGWPPADLQEAAKTIQKKTAEGDPASLRAAYLPSTSWFLLGAIIEQLSGTTFPDYIDQNILQPCAMNETRSIAEPENIEEHLTLFDRAKGALKPSLLLERKHATTPSPGSSFRGPAGDLRRFYDMLRNNGAGRAGHVLKSASLEQMTQPHRKGEFDQTLQHTVDYGLGLILDSKRYGAETVPYGFGDAASPRAYGHGGSQCAIGFADPERDCSVVIIANGRPGEGQHQRRFRQLLEALEQDLGWNR